MESSNICVRYFSVPVIPSTSIVHGLLTLHCASTGLGVSILAEFANGVVHRHNYALKVNIKKNEGKDRVVPVRCIALGSLLLIDSNICIDMWRFRRVGSGVLHSA